MFLLWMVTIKWNPAYVYGHILYKTSAIDFIMSLHWTNNSESTDDVIAPQDIDNPFIKHYTLHYAGLRSP